MKNTTCIQSSKNCILIICRNEKKPVFFVASRGHHADIGGITPGNFFFIENRKTLKKDI